MFYDKCIFCNIFNMKDNEAFLKYSFWIIILVGNYVYNPRLLMDDIYKQKCECADTNFTYVMNIIILYSNSSIFIFI